MSVTLNGNTYSAAQFTANGGYGYTEVFPEPIFTDMLAELQNVVTAVGDNWTVPGYAIIGPSDASDTGGAEVLRVYGRTIHRVPTNHTYGFRISNGTVDLLRADGQNNRLSLSSFTVGGTGAWGGGLFEADGGNDVVRVGTSAQPGNGIHNRSVYKSWRTVSATSNVSNGEAAFDSSAGASVSIANDGIVALTPSIGAGHKFFVYDARGYACEVIGGYAALVLSTGDTSIFTTTKDTASRVNIYVDTGDGNRVKIQNKIGGSMDFRITVIKF